MLSAPEAAASGVRNLFALLGASELKGLTSEDILLEEIERSEDNRAWLITLSYPVDTPAAGPLDLHAASSAFKLLGGVPKKRRYKTLSINSESGELLSMKIPG